MIRYATVGTNDVEKASDFYTPVLSNLGLQPIAYRDESGTLLETFYVPEGKPIEECVLVITKPVDGRPATRGNGTMIALGVPSREIVNAAHQAAMDHGGACGGPPGPRPHYHPQMYAGYFHDLDGNKFSLVYFAPVAE